MVHVIVKIFSILSLSFSLSLSLSLSLLLSPSSSLSVSEFWNTTLVSLKRISSKRELELWNFNVQVLILHASYSIKSYDEFSRTTLD